MYYIDCCDLKSKSLRGWGIATWPTRWNNIITKKKNLKINYKFHGCYKIVPVILFQFPSPKYVIKHSWSVLWTRVFYEIGMCADGIMFQKLVCVYVLQVLSGSNRTVDQPVDAFLSSGIGRLDLIVYHPTRTSFNEFYIFIVKVWLRCVCCGCGCACVWGRRGRGAPRRHSLAGGAQKHCVGLSMVFVCAHTRARERDSERKRRRS